MNSAMLGPSTSQVEVTNVSPHGFWLLLGQQELFVSFKEFPWFNDASIRQISNVELPSAHHVYWPALDIDLAVESLTHPERYPLMSALPTDQRSPTADGASAVREETSDRFTASSPEAPNVTAGALGSQHWLQVLVNRHPDVLLAALRRAGAISPAATIAWSSPLTEDGYCEYRDAKAIEKAGIGALARSLSDFWPNRGPVWDAIGRTSDGVAIFVEAKAHIPEAASPGTRATPESLVRISRSLEEARAWYAPRATADWTRTFYQYANRLAHHYFLRECNGVPAILTFIYFINAAGVNGPDNVAEWRGASRLLHAALGLPQHLRSRGVFDAFVDVGELKDVP